MNFISVTDLLSHFINECFIIKDQVEKKTSPISSYQFEKFKIHSPIN